jgi:hypothetical protein
VVHLLNTRLLEQKEVLRTAVREGNVVEALPAVLVLETVAIEPRPLSGPGPGMPRPRREKTELPGRLRIDLLSDTLFRVRYAEGSEAPENRTPMVIGNFEGPTESRVTVEDDRVVYTTGAATGCDSTRSSAGSEDWLIASRSDGASCRDTRG